MLVLRRKLGERIFIGGGISITVVETNNQWCRLGIEAPKETAVLRDDAIKTEPRPLTESEDK
jgi:carbon storage regulator